MNKTILYAGPAWKVTFSARGDLFSWWRRQAAWLLRHALWGAAVQSLRRRSRRRRHWFVSRLLGAGSAVTCACRFRVLGGRLSLDDRRRTACPLHRITFGRSEPGARHDAADGQCGQERKVGREWMIVPQSHDPVVEANGECPATHRRSVQVRVFVVALFPPASRSLCAHKHACCRSSGASAFSPACRETQIARQGRVVFRCAQELRTDRHVYAARRQCRVFWRQNE